MIARLHRFHGHNGLLAVYRRAQTARSPLVSLKFAPRPAGRNYRLAVVVSRKVSKSAVVRNRIRRRIYEQVRLSESKQTGPYDLIFTVYSETLASLEATVLADLLFGLLQKARVVTANPGSADARHDIVKRTRE